MDKVVRGQRHLKFDGRRPERCEEVAIFGFADHGVECLHGNNIVHKLEALESIDQRASTRNHRTVDDDFEAQIFQVQRQMSARPSCSGAAHQITFIRFASWASMAWSPSSILLTWLLFLAVFTTTNHCCAQQPGL
ncbi:hypothetical protein PR202_gb16602 [Eleusine coracana subsp. coracana]|uniref:Uncharacterized protein n=1 Tax=Eleusine coracana subsp. coracana TaxID=191504 RepID=A0AAV5F0S0_ELECO|nr:hypothetical protein PR202_gb16602 [Eleusine coracana subsp. coracana]